VQWSKLNSHSEFLAFEFFTNESYAKILNRDLSDFAGTWVNIQGERRQLYADGVFGFHGTVSNFGKNDEGTSDAYRWWVLVGKNEPIPGEYGYFVYLYPAGAAIDIDWSNSAFDSGTGRLHLSGPYQRTISIAETAFQDAKEDVVWHELKF